MPPKKGSSTSKTARVLNVISGEASSAAEDTISEPRSAAQQQPAPSRPHAPIMEMVKANDEALSEQIRVAMEKALDSDPVPAPSQQTTPPVAIAPPPAYHTEEDLEYINVMQALVEERTAQFMELFGLCTCIRCVTDVKALALTRLPPKYVVMRKGEVVPMLTVYEGRYGSSIIAELTHACRLVMSSPRHQR